jgi:pyruvate-formate lyase-activating enzyme
MMMVVSSILDDGSTNQFLGKRRTAKQGNSCHWGCNWCANYDDTTEPTSLSAIEFGDAFLLAAS